MKPANILINKDGILKLADFGLARLLRNNEQTSRYTSRVCTLWYRAPELLLGERNYGASVDMWSLGCIMAELFTRATILPGNVEQQQICLISQLCGSITPQTWPGVQKLELFNKIVLPQGHQRKLESRLRQFVRDIRGLDLIDRLMEYDPKSRLDANAALDHYFFYSDPMPSDLRKTLSRHSESMLAYFVPRHPQKNISQVQKINQVPRINQIHKTNQGPRINQIRKINQAPRISQEDGYRDVIY